MRCYGPQTFFRKRPGVYYSECGRVKICRLACPCWHVFLDGKLVEVDGKRGWATLREAAHAAAIARGMV